MAQNLLCHLHKIRTNCGNFDLYSFVLHPIKIVFYSHLEGIITEIGKRKGHVNRKATYMIHPVNVIFGTILNTLTIYIVYIKNHTIFQSHLTS